MPKNPRKPTKSKTSANLPPSAEMVVELLKQVRNYTVNSKSKCTGQCTVEREGQPPTVIMYASYPNGDYLTWFNDGVKFRLYALVNEKLKHIMEDEASEAGVARIIEKANELKRDLGT